MEWLDIQDRKELNKAMEAFQYCSGLLSELESDRNNLDKGIVDVFQLEAKYAGLLANSNVEDFRYNTYHEFNPGIESIETAKDYNSGLLFIGKVLKKIWEFIKTVFKKIVGFFKKFIGGKSESEIDISSLKAMVSSLEKLGFKHKKISEIWDGDDLVRVGDAAIDICFGGVNAYNGMCLLDFCNGSINAVNGMLNAYDMVKDTGTYRENTGLIKDLKIANGLTFDVNNGTVDSKGFDDLATKAFQESSKMVGANLSIKNLPANIKKISDGIAKHLEDNGESWGTFDDEAHMVALKIRDLGNFPSSFAHELHFAIRHGKLAIEGKTSNELGVSLNYNSPIDVTITLRKGETDVTGKENGRIKSDDLYKSCGEAIKNYTSGGDQRIVFISGSLGRLNTTEIVVLGAEFKDGTIKVKPHSVQSYPMSQALPVVYSSIDSEKKRIYMNGTSLFYAKLHRNEKSTSKDALPELVKKLVGDMTISDIGKMILEYGGEVEPYNKHLKSTVSKMEEVEKKLNSVTPIEDDNKTTFDVGGPILTIVRLYTTQMAELCRVVAKINLEKANSSISLLGDSIVSYCKKNNVDISKDDQGKIKVLSHS